MIGTTFKQLLQYNVNYFHLQLLSQVGYVCDIPKVRHDQFCYASFQ